jgi:hypothetical protein
MRLLFAGVAFVEAVHSAGRVNKLLLARKERMTFGTDFDVQIVFHCRAGLKIAAARADNRYLFVAGMNFGFHCFTSLY